MKSKWCLFMGILACVCSLFGCSHHPVRSDGELTSISISQSHMDRTYCYSFCAREENNAYLLDADCMIVDYDNDEYTEINFSETAISEEDFQQFAELDKKYDFFSLLKPNKEKKSIFFALDETITSFQVKYGDESLSLNTSGDCYTEARKYFFALAEKYNK